MLEIEDRIEEAFGMLQYHTKKISISERLAFLQYAIGLGQGHAIVGQVLFDLVDYARECFGVEEDMYSRYLFPDEEGEKSAYRHFRQTIGAYYDRFNEGLSVNPTEIVDYLGGWLAANELN